MSNRALTWAFEQELKSGPKFVLVALADWADEEGSCFPGVPTIAKRVGSVESAVRENLARLKRAGLIVEERRTRPNGSRTSNRYWLQMSGVVNLAPESGGGDLAPESVEPSAGIRGGQEPESGGPPNPQVNHQGNPQHVGGAAVTPMGPWYSLCQMLVDAIVANGSKRPTITKAWLDAARLLVERDHRTPQQVANMIAWSQQHEFWRANILSMPKLREKYDQMRLQAERDGAGRDSAVVAAGRALFEQYRQREAAAAAKEREPEEWNDRRSLSS